MDMKKLNVPTLEGPNWGEHAPKLQAAFRIFDCWDVVKGEILTPAPNPTYNLSVKPTAPPAKASTADLTTYQAAKAVWNKKNGQALGLHANNSVCHHLARLQPTRHSKRPV